MDSGPFRAPRSADTDRRVVNREPVQRPVAEPQPIIDEPQPRTAYAQSSRATPKESFMPSKKRFLIPLIVLVVIIVAIVGWIAWNNKQNAAVGIDSSRYQAVFSTSGLVYFGKLTSVNNQYYQLSQAYYLQSSNTTGSASASTSTTSTTTSNDQKLIKLSDAIHGPEDVMTIPKAQVLFYENLQTNSKVEQAIAKDNGK